MRPHPRLRGAALSAAIVLLSARTPLEIGPLSVTPVLLDGGDPGRTAVGELVYRGGLALSSSDPRFGGLSALRISSDGRRLTAVSDVGHWFTARLSYDGRGHLAGVDDVDMGPLHDPDGDTLHPKNLGDAESLAALPDGSQVVGFEHRNCLWRYPAGAHPLTGVPAALAPPDDLSLAPGNEGAEALTALADGRLLVITEGLAAQGGVLGWVGGAAGWVPFRYPVSGAPRPTGATQLPSGDLLVLERGYRSDSGVTIRVQRVLARSLEPGALLTVRTLAELRPPLTVDNFEGIDCRTGDAGEVLVYLISDDNFRRSQRTLLLMFSLAEEGSKVDALGPP